MISNYDIAWKGAKWSKIEISGQMWNVIPLDVREVGLIWLSWLGYNVVFMTREGLGWWHTYMHMLMTHDLGCYSCNFSRVGRCTI